MSPRLDPQSRLAYSAVCLWSWPALDPGEKPSLEYQSWSVLPSNSSSDGWARELHLRRGVVSPRRAPRAASRSAGRQRTEEQADRARRWSCIRGGFHELWEVRGQEYELDQNSQRNKFYLKGAKIPQKMRCKIKSINKIQQFESDGKTSEQKAGGTFSS